MKFLSFLYVCPASWRKLRRKKGPCRQLSDRRHVGSGYGALHYPGACSALEFCSDQPEYSLRNEPLFYFCIRHGNIAYSPGNLRRTFNQPAKIRHVDDQGKPHMRMDTAGSGRVFSHPGGDGLDMRDSIMRIRGRLFFLLIAGLIAVVLATSLSCSETKQPDTGRNISDSARLISF